MIDKGDRFFSKGDYHSALQNYEKAEELTPGDAKIKYRLGHVFLSLGQDSKALQYFEETYRKEPNVDADIDYFLGIALQLDFQFQRAISFFDSYKAKNGRSTLLAEHKIRECKLGDSLMRNPVLCNIKVFEWPLNSLYQDYGPALPADGSKLVFTSARDTTKLSKKNKTIFEDVLICKWDGQSWTSPEKISSQINDTFHDAATYLTPDGKTIFLYYERGNGDIYQSTFDGSEWSQPKSMGPEINTLSWETSGCLSPDGNRFYFTSDRAGGEGGLDIYYTEKLANGNWGKAVNLGPSVNTPGNEDAPFVHQDGTLYFGSDGHQGLGDYDIYKSVLIEKKWSKPVNLGFPINTPKLDNYFYLAPDKKRGYFSSARKDGVGKLDICSVTFLDPPPKKEVVVQAPPPTPIEKPKPEPVQQTAQSDEFSDAIVSLKKDLGFASKLIGRVIDAETAKPLKAQVVLIENTTNSVKSRVYTNDSTGEFIITIPHGGNYGINTSVEGYLFNSLNFEVPLYSDYQEIETAILMQKVTVGSKAVMKNIFFDIGKSDLKKESVGELERILELMEKNPGIKLQVNGHTDNSGDPGTNKVLSLKRAETVMDFLVNRGVKAERLKAVGFGQERPIVSNDDESGGREINRRTEIEILETDAGTEK
ncbi:MAG: PD40 domain-containing protein [Bacteroidetes bacterium]|nr:PD40 domain-containing protein [Bacteroidota bacterium]